MWERVPIVVVAIAALWLVVALWASTILFVFWHSGRQGLPGSRRVTWILLSLVPFAGFLAYLWARPAAAAGNGRKRRITMVKRLAGTERLQQEAGHLAPGSSYDPEAGARHMPTIAVAHPAPAEDRHDPPTLTPRPAPPGAAALAPPPRLLLSVVAGPHAGEKFPLDKLPAVIGRSAGSAVFLENDSGVSRQHAELYLGGRALWLRDLNSRHGTWLNGQRITETALAAGDTIRAGLSHLLLEDDM